MKTSTKLFFGILCIAVVGIAVVLATPQLFKGQLVIPTGRISVIQRCTHQWTKAFEGRYRYDPPPDTGTDRVDLVGVTAENIRNLAAAIQDGCDMKVQFQSVPRNAAFGTTALCEAVDLLTGPDSGYFVDCKFQSYLRHGEFFRDHPLYTSVYFWLEGDAPKLSKRHLELLPNPSSPTDYYGTTTTSLFGERAGDYRTDWSIAVFLKK